MTRPKFKIKKGDLVQVITGRTSDAEKAEARGLKPGDKGKQGKVLKVFPETQRVLVEGVNRVTKHVKPGVGGAAGGIEQVEAPIHISNVMLVDPKDNKPTRVGYRVETIEVGEGDAKRTKQIRVRYSKRTGEDI